MKIRVKKLRKEHACVFIANRLTEQIGTAFRLLKDLHDCHRDHLTERMTDGSQFTPMSQSAFCKIHPEHYHPESSSPLNVHLQSVFGADYRTLLDQMGFPVITDMKDVSEMAQKVEEELWRIYNAKNGLPRDNRTYRPNTSLPKFTETLYAQRFFETAFGSFRGAVKAVILHSELRADEEPERLSDAEIRTALEQSLEVGDIPAEYKEKAKAVSAVLEKEFLAAIDALTIPTESRNRQNRLCQPFNWRHMLFACPYLKEYGIKIYDIWVSKDRLEMLTNHPKKALSKKLKKIFFGPKSPVDHMREAPKLFRMDEEDIDFLEESDDYDALDYAYDALDLDFEEGKEPDAGQILQVMRMFQKEGITVPPKSYHFVHCYSLWPENCLAILKEKAAFFRGHPEIPFYVRQILFAAAKTTVGDIEAKMAVFEEKGIPLEHSAHFLHLIGEDHPPKAARMLSRTIANYEVICEAHAEKEAEEAAKNDPINELTELQGFLAEHLPRRQVPSIDELKALAISPRTIRRRVEKRVRRGQPVTRDVLDEDYVATVFRKQKQARKPEDDAAKAELRALGFPYEEVALHKRQTPTTILHKVKLMQELMDKVYLTLLSHSDEHILREAIRIQKKQDQIDKKEDELMALLDERGLEAPDWVWPLGNTMILRKIKYIEASGIPFTPRNLQRGFVHWSWINLGPGELDRKIADQRNKMRTEDRFAELEELYDFDLETMPPSLRNKTPDHLWRYLRAIDTAGLDLEDIGTSTMNAHGLVAFKTYLAQKLQQLEHHGTPLSSKQDAYVSRYEAAIRAEERYGWEDAYEILFSLPPGMFEEATAVIYGRRKNKSTADLLHQSLRQKLEDHKKQIKKLLREGVSYAELETLLV